MLDARSLARYRLIVNGMAPHGVSNVHGKLLNVADTVHPGSDYVTTITVRNLMPAEPARVARPAYHRLTADVTDRVARYV